MDAGSVPLRKTKAPIVGAFVKSEWPCERCAPGIGIVAAFRQGRRTAPQPPPTRAHWPGTTCRVLRARRAMIRTSGARSAGPAFRLSPTPNKEAVMAQKILMLVGDFVEDYEVMVPFQ